MHDVVSERWLPLAEAAAELGISIDTVRRRLRKGELQGEHRPAPGGFAWWVCVGAAQGPGASPGQATETTGALPDLERLVALVERLHAETRDQAALIGQLQARNMLLEANNAGLQEQLALPPGSAPAAERAWWRRWLGR